SSFLQLSMVAIDGAYTAVIPAGAVTMAGIDYYIDAVDVNGNSARTEEYYIQVIESPVVELPAPIIVIVFLSALVLWLRRANLR
ncbi:MAG: hypothetical protein QW115_05400, partial [Thermoplasmata archaeon]